MMQADRIPPHNIAAEQCVIGSLLIDGSSITQVSGFLEPEHFYREAHRLCYEVCLDLFTKNEAINRVTVSQGLRAKELLEEAGGRETLVACELAIGTSLDIEHYARIVEKAATLRRIINAGKTITALGYQEDLETDTALSTAEDTLFNIRQRVTQRDFIHMLGSFQEILEKQSPTDEDSEKSTRPIPTGFHNLDEIFMGGMQR